MGERNSSGMSSNFSFFFSKKKEKIPTSKYIYYILSMVHCYNQHADIDIQNQ
jgi:hypothetical protein